MPFQSCIACIQLQIWLFLLQKHIDLLDEMISLTMDVYAFGSFKIKATIQHHYTAWKSQNKNEKKKKKTTVFIIKKKSNTIMIVWQWVHFGEIFIVYFFRDFFLVYQGTVSVNPFMTTV